MSPAAVTMLLPAVKWLRDRGNVTSRTQRPGMSALQISRWFYTHWTVSSLLAQWTSPVGRSKALASVVVGVEPVPSELNRRVKTPAEVAAGVVGRVEGWYTQKRVVGEVLLIRIRANDPYQGCRCSIVEQCLGEGEQEVAEPLVDEPEGPKGGRGAFK